MPEPQAESALTEPCGHYPPQSAAQLHGVCVFCWRDRAGAARRAVSAAYLAGQLAMREQVAKQARELFERTYVFGCSIDGPATDNLDDAERRLAELVRALSPEEHRT